MYLSKNNLDDLCVMVTDLLDNGYLYEYIISIETETREFVVLLKNNMTTLHEKITELNKRLIDVAESSGVHILINITVVD